MLEIFPIRVHSFVVDSLRKRANTLGKLLELVLEVNPVFINLSPRDEVERCSEA
jgi:hypothetical protein